MDNTSVTYSFSGSIPNHYDDFLGPLFFEPYAIEMVKRINPSSIGLAVEIACGTGRITNHLRNALPGEAELIASDISPDMLAVAKQKLKDKNINWKIIDAQQLPFDNDSADLVLCGFGYMFVPDRKAAFSEAYRILKPGGKFLFSTWDKLENNGVAHIYRRTAREYLGDEMAKTLNLPFSMHDEEEIKSALKITGFSEIKVERAGIQSPASNAKDIAFALVSGGTLQNEIAKKDPLLVEKIRSIVENELVQKFGIKQVVTPLSALITEAVK